VPAPHPTPTRSYNNAAREFVSPKEAILSGVSKAAISFCTDANGDGIVDLTEGCLAVVLTENGSAARLVAKYRPPCPVVVVSPNATTLRSLSATFGLYPLQARFASGRGCCARPALAPDRGPSGRCLCPCDPRVCTDAHQEHPSPAHPQVESFSADPSRAISAGVDFALSQGLAVDGIKVLVVSGGPKLASADESPVVTSENLGAGGGGVIFCLPVARGRVGTMRANKCLRRAPRSF
jgi:hypothetical protein